jgi:hypothetical protein
LLCGPLVAGCGTATRVDFASHSRPASPVDISVYVCSSGVVLDPTRLSPGPVELNITNQSGRAVSLTVTASGHTLASSPSIPAGGTAQFKTSLSGHGHGLGVDIAGRPSSFRPLTLSGRARTGDNELTQP